MSLPLLPLNRAIFPALLFWLAGAVFGFAQLTWETTEIAERFRFGQASGEAVFRFENTGTYPVTIRSTSSSCGCTTAELTRRTYFPGEKGEIKARFETGDRVGDRRNTIQVVTNDPQNPTHALHYVVHIPAPVTITPRLLRWAGNREAEPQVVEVRIHPEFPAQVKGFEVDNANFEVIRLPGEDERLVRLQIRPLETNSAQRAIISLQTEPDVENRAQFSFYAYIR